MLVTPAHAAVTTAALWHMDTTDALVDSSGQGNTGTLTGVTPANGFDGSPGYHFGTVGAHAQVPDSNSLDPGRADFSVTAHVRFSIPPSASTVDYDLVRKGLAGATGGEWKMEIFPPSSGGASTAYCLFQDANKLTAWVRDARDLDDGLWHTITCSKTTSQIQVTVDGRSTAKSAALGSISNSAPLSIGMKTGGGDQYVGDMDEVGIWIDGGGG
jgi:hypothetical protein